MPDEDSDSQTQSIWTNRRKVLATVGIAGLAGYGATRDGGSDPEPEPEPEPVPSSDTDSPPVPESDTSEDESEENTPGTRRYKTSLPNFGGHRPLNPLFFQDNNISKTIGGPHPLNFALDQGYNFTPDHEYNPLHYDMSTDKGIVWVFDIKENLYPDGYDQITASDYVYQIQELLKPNWSSAGLEHQTRQHGRRPTQRETQLVREPDNTSVTQTGKFQFQIELVSREPLWPETLAPRLYPIPQGLVEPYVDEKDEEGLNSDRELNTCDFSGNMGAYDFEEIDDDIGAIRFSARDDYYLTEYADELGEEYANAPYFEGVDVYSHSRGWGPNSNDAVIESLKTGTVHSANVSPGYRFFGDVTPSTGPPSYPDFPEVGKQVTQLEEDDEITVSHRPSHRARVVSWNLNDSGWTAGPGNLFQQKKVRQGLSSAVSKEQFISKFFNGNAVPLQTNAPKGSRFYPGDERIVKYGEGEMYGSEVARNLITQGITQSAYDYQYDGDTLVTPDGSPVELELGYHKHQNTNAYEWKEERANFIAGQYEANAGINVSVTEYTTSEFPESGQDEWKTWDMLIDTDDDFEPTLMTSPYSTLAAIYHPVGYGQNVDEQKYNINGYENDELLQKCFDLDAVSDEDKYVEMAKEIQVTMNREQPWGLLAVPLETFAYRPSLNGPTDDVHNGYNYQTWSASEPRE